MLHHLRMSRLDKASPIPWGTDNISQAIIPRFFVSFIENFTGFTCIIHDEFHSFNLRHNQHHSTHWQVLMTIVTNPNFVPCIHYLGAQPTSGRRIITGLNIWDLGGCDSGLAIHLVIGNCDYCSFSFSCGFVLFPYWFFSYSSCDEDEIIKVAILQLSMDT